MKGTTRETQLEAMPRNTARGLRPGTRGLALRCVSGLLIVTQKGDPEDHELRSGDEFRTQGRGRVVAWALADTAFTARKIGVFQGRLEAA